MWKLYEKDNWDLSSVISLNYSLTVPEDVHLVTSSGTKHSEHALNETVQLEKREPSLGNFDEIWKFLNQPLDVAPPKIDPFLKVDPFAFSGPENIHITRDDSSNDNANAKAVRWRDEAEGADLEDNDQQDGLDIDAKGPRLTKNQRKKQLRRLQKGRKSDTTLDTAQLPASGNQSDSIVERQSKKRRALIQQITDVSPANGYPAILSRNLSQAFGQNCDKNRNFIGNGAFPLIRAQSAPSISFIPPITNVREKNLALAAARKANLISKLKAQFLDERPFLENLSVLQHTTNGTNVPVEGIHVFVDISNVRPHHFPVNLHSNRLDPYRLPRRP